jgi:hypothetical protein
MRSSGGNEQIAAAETGNRWRVPKGGPPKIHDSGSMGGRRQILTGKRVPPPLPSANKVL